MPRLPDTRSPPSCLLPDWVALPPPRAALTTSIVIPVRDEALRLGHTLAALAAQTAPNGTPLDPARFEIVVLANNCTDGSADVVRRFAATHPALTLHVVEATFPDAVAHVGHARASLMDEASRRLLRTAGPGGIIASTDGDTVVAADWLASTLAAFAHGPDAVGGRIVTAPAPNDPPALVRQVRRDDVYQLLRARLEDLLDPDPSDPWPRHHQHFGASLAVTAGAYTAVGGCPPEPFLEDEALVRRLREHDRTVRHSPAVRVVTSARRVGRVQVGLSQQLREWAAMAAAGDTVFVPDPRAHAAALVLRQSLRRLWLSRGDVVDRSAAPQHEPAGGVSGARPASGTVIRERHRLASLVLHLDIPPAWLCRVWEDTPTFGVVWRQLEQARHERERLHGARPDMPLAKAIVLLRRLIARARSATATPVSARGRVDRSIAAGR